MPEATVKETKAERVERIKCEKDGLDVLNDIYRYAASGEAVDPEDIDRFKWYGLYTQNRNLQDDEDETQYFMLRVKLEGGEMNARQARAMGEIAHDYARDNAHLTTRQDLQFHWITVKDLPAIFSKLGSVGLSTQQAAGDCPRNVVSCPVSGHAEEEIADIRSVVREINDLFRGNREFSNLPRKYKIGVCGCNKHCISHEIQDLAFSATLRDNGETVFAVTVGGGAASNRRIASHIGYVSEEQIVPVARAVAKIFREHGNRENRAKARVGHIVEAWGVEKFTQLLQEELGFLLLQPELQPFTPYKARCHFGIHAGKKRGKNYIGCAVTSGRLGAQGLLNLSDIMKTYGAKSAKATTTQNIVILDVATRYLETACLKLEEAGISPNPSAFKARTLACTGLNFCKFAVSETKELAISVVDYLQKRFPDFTEPVSISFNGCPNGCAHPNIVDIGFSGAKFKRGEERINGFELILGGHLEGASSRFGIKSGIKVAPDEAASTIEKLIEEYLQSNFISFRAFITEKINETSTVQTAA